MVGILKEADIKNKASGGKPNNLDVGKTDYLWQYSILREYRTYFYVASSYGIKKLYYRNITLVEDTLVKYTLF